jgi:glycosyltransferase involved in cell wall biosynthesis
MVMVATLRVAIVADMLEERWPSMDLMAEMLMAQVARSANLSPTLLRPAFAWPGADGQEAAAPPTIQRIAHRFWSYPRWLRRQAAADVYHIVDHSYAHLAHELPAGRVVVTCHDTDAFQMLMPRRDAGIPAAGARPSGLPRWLVNRIAGGLRRAACVVCDSEATRSELVAGGLVAEPRTQVVPIGVHPDCSAEPRGDADAAAARLTGERGSSDLLHVGSTIPRKRIDVLLEILAIVAKTRPDTRLWRVGGPFTAEQSRRARELGVDGRIVVLPFVSRAVLAALYRRASLVLLPSEREGFGLPVIESMACGTPIVCSDLEVLREVGGEAADYCPIADSEAWARRIDDLLSERDRDAGRWRSRQAAAIARSSAFSWPRYAEAMEDVYARVTAGEVAR